MQTKSFPYRRFADLEIRDIILTGGQRFQVVVAENYCSRLLGLAHLSSFPSGAGLFLPNTRSIHTVGMRFPLDLIWLAEDKRIIRIDRNVMPYRFRSCRQAYAVIEKASAG